ncbi:16S rRNA (uracil(1498)-N(3))-methyltransferase [Marinicrinis lubricantis]|uniref:Ribosomal RNA small subunit methyltransferase E n=1 Tax=Marinicrinis lubricantis TaxID=2086470 RepID=A0ABW1IUY9_9BACL
MQRYFVQAEQLTAHAVEITGEDAHHISHVMRLKPEDRIIVSNGLNREAIAEIREVQKGLVIADIVEELAMDQEPSVDIWIFQSLPKGDKMETVIQKGTELGATRFVPFQSSRTIVQYDSKKEAKRLERWRKIAKEAAEQAHRGIVPEVAALCSWKEMLEMIGQADSALFCYEKERDGGLKKVLELAKERSLESSRKPVIAVIVGPEGGFTEEETAQAEHAGCYLITLGKRILRTETAAMAAAACILYEFDEIGGS